VGATDDPPGVEPAQGHRSADGSVAADGDEGVDPVPLQHFGRPALAFFLEHGGTAAGMEDRAAALQDVAYAAKRHPRLSLGIAVEILFQQSLVAAADAHHFVPPGHRGANHRPDAGVHSRCVAAATEEADPHGFRLHKIPRAVFPECKPPAASSKAGALYTTCPLLRRWIDLLKPRRSAESEPAAPSSQATCGSPDP